MDANNFGEESRFLKKEKKRVSQKQGKKIVIKSHSALQDGCFAEEE